MLEPHFSYMLAERDAARRAPLSTKRAMLVAMLADAYVDRLFRGEAGDSDILAYRAALAGRSAALATLMALCARKPDAPTLVIDTVEVPLADYPGLGLEDFMVSLYNGHTVQRVRVVLADGTRLFIHDVLDEAIAFLATLD